MHPCVFALMYYYLLSIMYCIFLATKFKLKTKPKKDEKQKHKVTVVCFLIYT